MTLHSGSLNSRIRIEARVQTVSDYGDPEITGWQSVGDFWANVRNVNGKEYVTRGVDVEQVNTSIRIRLNRAITAQMRVVHRNQIYAIHAVLHDETGRQYTDLACALGNDEGK